MNNKLIAVTALTLFGTISGAAQTADHGGRPTSSALPTGSASASATAAPEVKPMDELSPQSKEMAGLANSYASDIVRAVDKWVAAKEVTEEKLVSRLYYPIPKSDPVKFSTDYDSLFDRDLQKIEDSYLEKSSNIIYVVFADVNGYVPTHNTKYSQQLTGDRAVDLVNNRTKRLFVDATGFKAARSEAPMLLQVYQRDNGERLGDLSVPVTYHGKHFGCVRVGFRISGDAR